MDDNTLRPLHLPNWKMLRNHYTCGDTTSHRTLRVSTSIKHRSTRYLVDRHLKLKGLTAGAVLRQVPEIANANSQTIITKRGTSQIDTDDDKKRDAQILSLYLDGWTQQEIGEKFKLDDTTVSKILKDLKKRTGAEIQVPDSPQIGDSWSGASCQVQATAA